MKQDPETQSKSSGMTPQDYWKKNLTCVVLLLAFWFAVSYGCGVLFVDALDEYRLPGTGYKLGFWFAQQGSIYGFLAIIWIYVWYMNRLDHRYAKGK